MRTLIYGAHMSIAGGLEKAILKGQSIGCTAIQIFTKNNRRWQAKKLNSTEINLFKTTKDKSSIKTVVAHAGYLINIGSSITAVQEQSVVSLAEELQRCTLLDIPYLVLHPGTSTGPDFATSINTIIKNLDNVFDHNQGNTVILLENMTGQDSTFGTTFEQLSLICNALQNKKRIGICFDTCHAWASGYDFSTKTSYELMWEKFDWTIGLEYLKVIHVNDSKKPYHSQIDRHEAIGSGTIGLEAFKLIMNDERFDQIPKILETPKVSLDDDLHNLKILETLVCKKIK